MLTSLNTDSLQHGPLKILFAGGCHVNGYPIGEELSFPTIVRNRLLKAGVETEVHRLSHLKLTHRRRLLTASKEVHPDVVVLQPGHDVLNQRLSWHLRSMLGRPRPKAADSDILAACVRNAAMFYARGMCKAAIDRLLGHPLVNFQQFEKQMTFLLSELKTCDIPFIVMLTPLACADPITSYYRKQSLPCYQRVARQCEVDLLDVLADAPGGWQRHFGAAHDYYDAIHLGAAGHRMVGQAISCHLQKVLTACTVREAAR